jgi:hypothetical protein
MILGFCGAAVAFVVNMLYSLFHTLGVITGIANDQSHFFIGTGLAILAAVGAFLALGSGELGAALMVLSLVGFAFIIGWWTIIPALLLLPAAGLVYVGRRSARAATS